MRAIIYAANIRGGGAVGGAAGFVDCLPGLHRAGALSWADDWEVVISDPIANDMERLEEVSRLDGVHVTRRTDARPLRGLLTPGKVVADVRLVVRGPDFAGPMARREVVGFADRSILVRAPSARLVFQNGVKRRRLRGYQGFFAQTERMASYLRGRFPDRPTWIVPNSPSELFRTDASQQSIDHVDSRRVTLIYPARGYPHKNHRMIPEVTRSLKARHGITLRVLCTLRPDEVEHLGFGGIDGSGLLSVGEVGLRDCRKLYDEAVGVFFPSLNETSSVTPLEGMALGLPVFSSNLDFIREVCGEVPFYFDPTDAEQAADLIAHFFTDPSIHRRRLAAGRDFVRGLPSPSDRAREYLGIMRRIAETHRNSQSRI